MMNSIDEKYYTIRKQLILKKSTYKMFSREISVYNKNATTIAFKNQNLFTK